MAERVGEILDEQVSSWWFTTSLSIKYNTFTQWWFNVCQGSFTYVASIEPTLSERLVFAGLWPTVKDQYLIWYAVNKYIK